MCMHFAGYPPVIQGSAKGCKLFGEMPQVAFTQPITFLGTPAGQGGDYYTYIECSGKECVSAQ